MKINTAFLKEELQPTYDSDAIDRLRYYVTVGILSTSSVFIISKQYVGQSIQCWLPKQFKGGWEKYIETYCLVENSYFVNMNQTNLPKYNERENIEMKYYQWVPFILLLLAFSMLIPRIVWNLLKSVIGIDISIVTSTLREKAKDCLMDTKNDIQEFSRTLKSRFDRTHQNAARRSSWGFQLTICLLITKILSAIIIALSIGFLGYFIGGGPLFGWNITRDLINKNYWPEIGTFPRVTFCDVQIRELGYVNNWSFQCVLMVNMFNEKLFVFLWWWYSALMVLSIYDLLRFAYRLTTLSQISFIQMILEVDGSTGITRSQVSEFNRQILKSDGITLMHIIHSNATIFEAHHFLEPLWKDFNHEEK